MTRKVVHYKRWDDVTRKVVRDDPDEKMGRDVQVRDGFGAASPGTRMVPCWLVWRLYKPKSETKPIPLSLMCSIKILTFRIRGSWVYLPYLFTNCVTRSCDLLDRFIQTCIGSTSWRITGTLQCPDSVTNFSKMFFVVENISILSLIFILDHSNIMAIKDKYWFFVLFFVLLSSIRFFCLLLSRIRIRIRIVYWWNAETTIIHQDLWTLLCKQAGVLFFILWRIVMRRNRQVYLRRIWHAQGNEPIQYVASKTKNRFGPKSPVTRVRNVPLPRTLASTICTRY